MLDNLRRLLFGILLCLLQALVFSHIRLFGYATPLLYVYFAIKIPRGYPRGLTLLWCFAVGLVVDMFADTPGVAAASMTLIGLVQPYLLELFLPRDAEPDMPVGIYSMEWGKFTSFSFLMVAIYCLVFFSIEAFSVAHWQYLAICFASSTLLTLTLILACEMLAHPKS